MSEVITRRNAVRESVRGDRRQVHRLWLQKGLDRKLTADIVTIARQKKIPIQTVDKQKLGHITQDSRHQGVALETGPYLYSDIESILELAKEQNEQAFILILDLLHGPQNIGSLLRTAEICGVHGVILQDRRAPDITPAVVQYSAGATEHLLIAQVTNLVQTIKRLQEKDVWVAGMDFGEPARPLGQVDLDLPLALVIGHEGSGLRRLVRNSCDFLLELPMRGHVESLNAAAAGSIALYAAWQARGFTGAKE